MALIYRSIFEVQDDAFTTEAGTHIENWLRWKLRSNSIVLPGDGTTELLESGREITGRTAVEGGVWGLRAALFEPKGEEELRTTITAACDGDNAWFWVDLERWSADAFVEPWVPVAPGVIGAVLQNVSARRGPSALSSEAELFVGEEGERLAERVLDADRELPYIVVSPTRGERDQDMQPAMDRAHEMNRRLTGIAPVAVLGAGAVSRFSHAMFLALGDGFDVHSGAVRTYLPSIGSGDSPRRHRFVPFSRIRGRPARLTAEIVASAVQRGACAQPPPTLWRETLRHLLEPPAGASDDEIQEDMLKLERKWTEEAALRLRAERTLDAERETAGDTERENDDLHRRIAYLQQQLREAGANPGAPPVDDTIFIPDFCGEVPPEVALRLSGVVFPESQWSDADDLDQHTSTAWARRAWRAFKAMDTYAAAKRAGTFGGSFLDYCDDGRADAVQVTWIALSESESTDTNRIFRRLRTLPVSTQACPEGKVYMPAHIKIEQGGYPAPRIHFYDDTGGPTGKIHIGYFGVHLKNDSTN